MAIHFPVLGNKIEAKHDSYWPRQENFALQSFGLTKTFSEDLPFLCNKQKGNAYAHFYEFSKTEQCPDQENEMVKALYQCLHCT